MDQWDFKKWRKKLGVNQAAAGKMLGLSRGAVQNWENEIRPVPLAVELACKQLLRRWKQQPEYGPVTLLYAEGPMSRVDSLPCDDLVFQRETYPDNESALGRVARLRETVNLFMPLIVAGDGTVIWSSLELQHECDAQERVRGEPSDSDA